MNGIKICGETQATYYFTSKTWMSKIKALAYTQQ